jgi:hypothetical protein
VSGLISKYCYTLGFIFDGLCRDSTLLSAYLRAQALGTGVSEAEADAMTIFDGILDEMTARFEAANAGLVASLGRTDAASPGGAGG